jgi:hypothetical protein
MDKSDGRVADGRSDMAVPLRREYEYETIRIRTAVISRAGYYQFLEPANHAPDLT